MSGDLFHLAFFGSFAPSGWRSPFAGQAADEWHRPKYWGDMAEALERACFDFAIFEDESFIEDVYGGNHDYYLRNGLGATKQDPAVLATIMALSTSRLGIVPTMSTMEYPPYLLARLLNTLDHVSSGRIGWNVVTGHARGGAQNYGLDDLPPHDLRYDMADEFITLADKLWRSWDDGALVADAQTGVWADPAKVHAVDFEGAFFRSRGPLNNSRSPQVRPLIVQAGASPRGRDYASKHADAVVGGMTGPTAMREYREDMRARAVGHGRRADDIKVLFQVRPILGATEDEARLKADAITAAAAGNIEMGLVTITLASGVDLSRFDLDMPMNEIAEKVVTDYGQSSLNDIFRSAGTATLREFAGRTPSWRIFEPVGTPDSVAAQMAELMAEIDGDGYLVNIMGDSTRRALAELTDGLVPALQRRGVVRTEYSHTHLRDNVLAF